MKVYFEEGRRGVVSIKERRQKRVSERKPFEPRQANTPKKGSVKGAGGKTKLSLTLLNQDGLSQSRFIKISANMSCS